MKIIDDNDEEEQEKVNLEGTREKATCKGGREKVTGEGRAGRERDRGNGGPGEGGESAAGSVPAQRALGGDYKESGGCTKLVPCCAQDCMPPRPPPTSRSPHHQPPRAGHVRYLGLQSSQHARSVEAKLARSWRACAAPQIIPNFSPFLE